MLLPFTTPEQVAQTYCVPWNPSDPLMDLYEQAATQFDTDSDASLHAIILVSLQNRMTLYRKSRCTDCAGPANLQGALNTGAEIDTGIAAFQTGISAAASIAGVASSLAKALPVIGQIDSVITSIVGVFTKAHAQAVAKEQAVNCAAAQQFNTYVPNIDAAVASGKADAESALQALHQIAQVIQSNLDQVTSAHNWGWGAGQVLQAQVWFREQWYPQLAANAENPISSITGGPGSTGKILLALIVGGAIFIGARGSK